MTEVISLEESTHSVFGPSACSRIAKCPASLARHKDNGGSLESATGTVAHAIHEELLLQLGLRVPASSAVDFIGKAYTQRVKGAEVLIVVDREMAEAVQESVDEVAAEYDLAVDRGDTPALWVETKVDVSRWTPVPDQTGTADAFMVSADTVTVFDYKHGRGVAVSAFENIQTALYAGGVLEYLLPLYGTDLRKVSLRIHQPRNGGNSSWNITVEQLYCFLDEIKDRLALALLPDAPFGPAEDVCRFCSAKPTCHGAAAAAGAVIDPAFSDLTSPEELTSAISEVLPPAPSQLSSDQLFSLWEKVGLLEMWAGAVAEEVKVRLLQGETCESLKLVEGRSSRKWIDTEKAPDALLKACPELTEDSIYERSLLSVAAVEKLLAKKDRGALTELYVKTPGKLSVARADDKRPAVVIADCLSAFDDVSESE